MKRSPNKEACGCRTSSLCQHLRQYIQNIKENMLTDVGVTHDRTGIPSGGGGGVPIPLAPLYY